MLSTIHAAEAQFRYESETRKRELALLASIRERRAAESTQDLAAAARPPVAISAQSLRPAVRRRAAAWPRPIGIKNCETTACAVA
jgi:hypothetical protein